MLNPSLSLPLPFHQSQSQLV